MATNQASTNPAGARRRSPCQTHNVTHPQPMIDRRIALPLTISASMDSPIAEPAQSPALASDGAEVCAQGDIPGKSTRTDHREMAPLSVSVRALCAFAARRGDLDLRFTPSPSAQQGREGHRLVAKRRGESYESEITLSATCGDLTLNGRADGYDPRSHELEEIKTHRGRVEDLPANQRFLHWAQARLYAWMLARERKFSEIGVCVVYFDIGSQTETRLSEATTTEALEDFARGLCQSYTGWAKAEAAHRERRQRWLAQLAFPMDTFRAGQRGMAAAVWRACERGENLRLQAPTGIGKTLGTLYPALRAMASRPLDRIAILSARTTARQLALNTLQSLRPQYPPQQAMPIRVIEIVARERACEHPDKACHGQSCPLAQGFYDRLAQARKAASERDILDRQTLRTIALAHRVCPYFLSMEMLRWCDIAVGDYHYWFDRHAVLAALSAEHGWRVAVLIDEAHQLVSRTRAMYSETASLAELLRLAGEAPAALSEPTTDLINQWDALAQARGLDGPDAPLWQSLPEVPESWLRALHRLALALADYVAKHAHQPPGPLLEAWFRSLSFLSLAESFGEHSICELSLNDAEQVTPSSTLFERPQDRASITLRNVVPAPFLKPRVDLADSLVMFSATMNPWEFDRDLLGLDANTRSLEIDSPFDPAHLRVQVLPISTRLEDRERSLDRMVRAMAEHYLQARGNYLAFFSSFDYLARAAERLALRHPDVPLWTQARGMNEFDKQQFLSRFTPEGHGIGFAVLGGAFGEGIDLPGRRLIGAFIATLGMPQADAINEAISQRMHALFGEGHRYTYVIPGLQKVVQAAGRVIRAPDDRGSLLLMDARYSWPRYRALLPRAWGLGSDEAQ